MPEKLLDAALIVRAVNSHDALVEMLDVMTNEWADRLGQIAKNCKALDRTVSLDIDIAHARKVLAAAKGEA